MLQGWDHIQIHLIIEVYKLNKLINFNYKFHKISINYFFKSCSRFETYSASSLAYMSSL